MKIAFVLELYYPNIGGVEKLFKSLAEELVADGHQVCVVTSRFSKELEKKEIINGVQVIRSMPNRFLFSFFIMPVIIKHAKGYDCIHTTSYNAGLPAYFASKILRKKCYITFHEVWGKLWFTLPFINKIEARMYYTFERFLLSLGFDKYIAPSDYTANCLKKSGVNENKVVRIYNGIDYSKYRPDRQTNEKRFVYSYFGRLGSSKGLDLIIKAASAFNGRHPDAWLKLIIPDIPRSFHKKVLKLLNSLHLGQSVMIRSNLPREELMHELSQSDCVLIPSYSEGFCFAAVETIAMDIPLISSGKGALQEVVGGTHIVMEEHSPNGLLDALEDAYQGKWKEMPVRQFELKDTVSAYLRLYSENKSL